MTPPTPKNIAKRLECCSKSHFSPMRIYVEKVMPIPFILERFLVPKSTQERKKMVLESVLKSWRFLYRFFLDFRSILDPKGHLKIELFWMKFCSWCRSWGILAPGGSPKRSKRVSEADFSRIGYYFGVFFQRFDMIFSKNQHENFKKQNYTYVSKKHNIFKKIIFFFKLVRDIFFYFSPIKRYIDTPIQRHNNTPIQRYDQRYSHTAIQRYSDKAIPIQAQVSHTQQHAKYLRQTKRSCNLLNEFLLLLKYEKLINNYYLDIYIYIHVYISY